jgi:thiamine biosynthesis lipoprotein ApbE
MNLFSLRAAALLLLSPPHPPALYAQGTLHTAHYENVLGTSLELKLQTPTDAVAQRAEAATLAEIDRENALLSAWQSNSEFSRWTRTHNTPVKVSPELLDVLSLFESWCQQTHGALDASAETAVRLWKLAESDHRQPTSEELAAAVRTMRQPHWSIDRAAGTATHLDDAPIALNSFAKSYIAGHAVNAALAAGATGISLNLGGDIVLRGSLSERVAIANPHADAENDTPVDLIRLSNRTIATSGAYRRGVDIQGRHFSHIVDPRTGLPAEFILSSTVIAPDPSEAGALATAFSVMTPAETKTLAARLSNVDYLLITADGQTIASPNWSRRELPHIQPAAFHPPVRPRFDLVVTLELARVDAPRYHRPYVAVWVEDANRKPVKTIALWSQKPRYLSDLRSWYHDDQARVSAGQPDLAYTLSSATRPPGKYTLRWDGTDDAGKPLPPGPYTILIEAAREHGTYQLMKQEIDFNGRTPRQVTLPENTEIAGATLDYGPHEQ